MFRLLMTFSAIYLDMTDKVNAPYTVFVLSTTLFDPLDKIPWYKPCDMYSTDRLGGRRFHLDTV